VLSFTQVLNGHIEKTRITREGPAPAWYASSLGGCDRKAVLRRSGVKGTPFDIRTLRKFWMGDRVHDALKDAVENEIRQLAIGPVAVEDPSDPDSAAARFAELEAFAKKYAGVRFLGHELSVRDDEYHVAGRVDTAVVLNGVVEAWEYKSIASGAFKYNDLPQAAHQLQLGVYLTFPLRCPLKVVHEPAAPDSPLGSELPPCPTCGGERWKPGFLYPQQGRLIYWSKDDALMDEYIIQATPELKSNVKETLRRLEAAYEAYLANPENLDPVLPLIQDKKKDKKTGKYVPFFYVKDYTGKDEVFHPKGSAKMIHDHRCISKNNTNPCEYFGNACPVSSWDIELTSGPGEGQEEEEAE
jgi:hypothetical protein